MTERHQQNRRNPLQDKVTGNSDDGQGIDNAPGKESAQHIENEVSQTQRGKNKVDGDPSKQSDQPVGQKGH